MPAQPTIPDAGGVARKFWIDPSIAAWRPGPWRKVHIEYHTSRHMPRLAERFNADEFGDRLLAAHVNGATVFAKDMYGYSYFPNTHGRMHPNLSFDLLGAQVAALEEAEDLGPRLLHADLESRTGRSASRMAGRPPARRQVSSQARGDLRGTEGVHEYPEARCPPPPQDRCPLQARRAARRRQGISTLPVAVLHRPGGVPEGGARPHPGARLQV